MARALEVVTFDADAGAANTARVFGEKTQRQTLYGIPRIRRGADI